MTKDSDYFRQRAAEARAASYTKNHAQDAAVAGDLALAYRALARRHASADLQPSSFAVAVTEPG